MGSVIGSTMRESMEENLKKNQEFMLKTQRMQVRRYDTIPFTQSFLADDW